MIFDDICKRYKVELENYNYISDIETFLNLDIKGNIKYINKIDSKLRSGGILLKTYYIELLCYHY